ncbi:MAG: tetratricopeptide repeat protein, partial [Pseudomonadota bacterium]
QKAVAVYKNVLKLSPGTVAAHLKLGALFKQLGLMSDAVQQFDQGALALQRGGKLVDAVAALRQAIEIQPDNVVLRVKLAESASQAGLNEEAVREFAKAAEQLKAHGRIDESMRVIERLLFHQPTNFARARELAEAYIAKGSPRLALPKLQACLNADERDPRTLSLLAKALEQLGQAPKAIAVLKELVRLCEDLGRANERDAAVLRGLTLDPDDRELRAASARNQVRDLGESAAEATPPPVVSRNVAGAGGGTFDLSGIVRIPAGGNSSGRVVAAVGSTDSGGRSVGSRVSLDAGSGPDLSRVLAEADVFVKYGLLERAADHLGRVFDVDPESRDARERLIAVLQRLGRTHDAAQHLTVLAQQVARTSPAEGRKLAEKALRLDPGCEKARALFAELTGSRLDPLPGIALDVPDDDPSADLLTPPLTRLSPTLGPNDLDADVHPGDFMIDLVIDEDEASAAAGARHGEVAEDLVTPPPAVAGGASPLVVARRDRFEDTVQDDDDPAGAFSENAATIAVDGLQDLIAAQADSDEAELSAELKQVDFFVDRALSEEARALLRDLATRFPRHPRVAGKLRELQLLDARLSAGVATLEVAPRPPLAARRPPPSRTIIEGPSIESTPSPRAVVEGGHADFSTHADLAVAYKEMGLFDAAIGELKLLALDPTREVFALTTMGECFEAKGTFTEAVLRYKRALNCEQVTREETLALYYLLGGAFERLGDISEALYFYEKVTKREPSFRDAIQKVADLKPRMVKRAR